MSVNADVSVDVERIMREIRKKAHENSAESHSATVNEMTDSLRSEPIDMPEFLDALERVNARFDIPYYFDLGSSGLKLLVKRIIRKLCKFLFIAILAMQNGFNGSVVACLNQIRYHIIYSKEENQLLRQEIAEIRESCRRELAESKESCKSEIAEIRESCRREIAESEESCKSEIAEIRESCRREIAESEESCKREIAEVCATYTRLNAEIQKRIDKLCGEIEETKTGNEKLDADLTEQARMLKQLADRLTQQETQALEVETVVSNLKDRVSETEEQIERDCENTQAHGDKIAHLELIGEEHGSWFVRQEDINHDLEARLRWREKDDEGFKKQIDALERENDTFSSNVAKLILKREKNSAGVADVSEKQNKNIQTHTDGEQTYSKLDYFKFQNHFRGSRALITQRQKIYLPYFKECHGTVLDIGCGRGEFLNLMKENHIPAFGIDLYPEYVVEGELNGIDVRQGDGVDFLCGTERKFGGIFCAQVIEHISFSMLQRLCFAAYEKLEDGGYLVLETPNPTCLSIFSGAFYTDPTHNKPLPPWLVEYVLQEAGFRDTQVLYTEASRAGEALPQIESDSIQNLDEVNHAISKVSDLLYGSQDYAIIAKK